MINESSLGFNKEALNETEENTRLSNPIKILIPERGNKPYICDFQFSSIEEKNKIITELNNEIRRGREAGIFGPTGGNIDGFNVSFLVDGKKIKMSFIADIPTYSFTDLTKKNPKIEDQGEEKIAFTKRHEDAHGVFNSNYEDLETMGKGKAFVDNFIDLLKTNGLWEKQTQYVLENWNLVNLGFTYSEKVLSLQNYIRKLLESKSLDIDKIFDIVKKDFGQEQLDVFKKGILIEIDGDAHGYEDRTLINLMRQAQVNVAGKDFLHRNAPMEA